MNSFVFRNCFLHIFNGLGDGQYQANPALYNLAISEREMNGWYGASERITSGWYAKFENQNASGQILSKFVGIVLYVDIIYSHPLIKRDFQRHIVVSFL